MGHLVYLDAANPVGGESLADIAAPLMDAARAQAQVVDGVELVLAPGTPREELGMSGSVRRLTRHYLEMVAAMIVGMIVLGGASSLVLDLPDRTSVELVAMAIWMTLPMVAWMRFRGCLQRDGCCSPS